ncbi:DEAD/DEAH box helicase family protein [Mycobacteroides chelonae]|uniref:DEAD/DEAH box helicase n=1 Tax=Mycobacteroides chelonae TaxID=1774 RepID=UPI0019104C6A|nr:DEAD/DEAH box helicase family protein [Mycobacteroides chelonae]QQG96741.1 DEAD/DEAH box helicase family protein [Mycobacteroides chelonae]
MAGHYGRDGNFLLFSGPSVPEWRAPQRGALGSLLAYWSLPHLNSAVVSVPTGSGKSAIATAAPYLLGANRVLVVVPSRDLRAQLVDDFRFESVLRSIGALAGDSSPNVVEVTGLVDDWEPLRSADVVVGLPQSLSPLHYELRPPADLFDLVVIDEAHHAPAHTWRAILDHFAAARSVLLTATPQRRDGQRIPGEIVFHYPLRQAIAEGLYKEVRPVVVDVPAGATRQVADRRVAEEVVNIVRSTEHATSTLMIRAATVGRANELATLYGEFGIDVTVLTSRMAPQLRELTVAKLRAGEISAVAVVDMLGEGFDLPRLRIAAYHDKHKSTVSTVQLIGRLARVEPAYPQESVIITPRDVNVYPQLQGVVRRLWEEDADWTRVLPGLIDDEVEEALTDRAYAARLQDAPPELSVEAIQPGVMAILYEIPEFGWAPDFVSGVAPESLAVGQPLRGRSVFYSAVTPGGNTLVVVTVQLGRPKWHPAPGLDTEGFELHLVTWRPPAQTEQAGVLAVNSRDQNVVKKLLEILAAPANRRIADPQRLQEAFDSLDRRSVSNVGVRNTHPGGDGVSNYKTFMGKGVDRGLRDADTGRGALGHAMAQIDGTDGSFTAGIATGKGKIWESRDLKLRRYEQYMSDYIDRYWFPPAQPLGRLLPGVSRGSRINKFPDERSLIAAIELDPALYVQDWYVGEVPLSDVHLCEDLTAPRAPDALALAAYAPGDVKNPIWRGWQDRDGSFHDFETATAKRGYGSVGPLSDLLSHRPPSIYYSDGQTIIGSVIYAPTAVRSDLPTLVEECLDWTDVETKIETEKKLPKKSKLISVGRALEQELLARPKRFRHRWILHNDGAGEIADYLVLEVLSQPDRPAQVKLELWHAKAAGGAPSVRVKDLQVLLAQAIKSRRWATDRGLWSELGARLVGEKSPKLTVCEGSETLLKILCGRVPEHPRYSFARYTPMVDCNIGIVQPGLSMSMLREELARNPVPLSAQQVCELLTVWHDAVSTVSKLTVIAST